MEDMFFKTCKLHVGRNTPMASVMAVLGEAGVLIDGRYSVSPDDSGTTITYLGTRLQSKFISKVLDDMKESGLL